MYDIRRYYPARSVSEALALLAAHPDAKLIAGGSDILLRIREGRLSGCTLVGIGGIQEITGISRDEQGDIRIGAATTFSRITADPVINSYIPVLGRAVDQVGGPQIRNVGTIGGNLCNGAVSADSASTLFSLEAKLALTGQTGERIVPIEDFYLGPGKVDIRPGELLTRILISRENYDGYFGHYIKYAMRNAMDIATLGCSVAAKTDSNILTDVRITFGVAAPVPLRCRETEEKLRGMEIGETLYHLAEEGVRAEIKPRDSWRASKAFRLQIGGEIARRALKQAIMLAGGGYG